MIDFPIEYSVTTTQAAVFSRERDQSVFVGRPSSASTVLDIDSILQSMRANFAAATYGQPLPHDESEFEIEPFRTFALRVPIKFLGPAPGLDFSEDDDLVLFDE